MRFLLLLPLLGAQASQAAIPQAALEKLIAAEPAGPGCAAVVIEHGRVVAEAANGFADLETERPMTLDTPVNVASLTKQFTGMAIALLIGEGKLSETDDIRRFLPELKNYGHAIRVEHLLNHSSGLRNHMALAAFQPGDHLPSHEEALALVFRQSALNFEPGTRHQYESPNYVLLAEIVSRVSGMPYPRFVDERILKPLGMSNSGFDVSAVAPAYVKKDGRWMINARTNRAMGSSGLQASARDFAKWMLNYDRMSVGDASAMQRMLSSSRLSNGTAIPYRYGLVKEFNYAGVKGLTRISHGGQTAAYRSAFSYFPGRSSGNIVVCNHMADANAIDQAIVEGWYKADPGAEAASEKPVPARLGRTLSGWWYSNGDDESRRFEFKDGKLLLRLFGDSYPLNYVDAQRFLFPGVASFRFGGRLGVMRESADGQATLDFARLTPPARQDLAPLSGSYRSAEVDGTVEISTKDSKLLLAYPAGEAELEAIGKDLFANPDADFYAVRLERDGAGRVAGLTISTTSGIKRLRFRKS